jgi:hypothetical protein
VAQELIGGSAAADWLIDERNLEDTFWTRLVSTVVLVGTKGEEPWT